MSSGGWQNGSNSSSSSNSSSDYGTGRFRPYANGSSSNNVNASDQGFSFPVEPIQNPLSAYSADLGSGNANTLELAGIPSNVQGISAEDLNLEDIEIDQEQTDVVEAVRGLIRFAGLRYLTTIIANPFQIAQTLLQVQYNPNDARGDVEYSQSDINEEELFSDNPNVYRSAERKAGGPQSIYDPDGLPQGKAKVDHDGYVISVSEDKSAALRPAYQLSTLPGGKVRVLKRLVSHPTEGVLSPFKGKLV
ncbi:hypothetical protein H4219_003985 [Mycoemilia scoparia]|uniref:Uncharacterized protein n=1 Tax=Mycoemilia scoparia TaxID=417184 RepID=A0A9W7ZT58_9FUNG|nr:hypothetical protein H4219_003985 [Mycoemilia scoparia]